MIDEVYISKSFVCVGDSLSTCFNCKYCRLLDEWDKNINYVTLPYRINKHFLKLPIVINLFYGDPLLQLDNTISYLRRLEMIEYKGPVVIITKGNFSKFPDVNFNLDLHIAFSTFGLEEKEKYGYSNYDGSTFSSFIKNLATAFNRTNKYKYSIEFRPIIYNINDSYESIKSVFSYAGYYGLSVGFSGLQGKPDTVKIWNKKGYPFKPYPGFKFGHKKSLSKEVISIIDECSSKYNVETFKKTSCLISYVHNLNRDYNAHYYRPSEVGCIGCVMETTCKKAKSLRDDLCVSTDEIPFKHELIRKDNHVCILKKKGICEFPTYDCSHISGGIVKIDDKITTADVRVIKWLTGYTVDADFEESPFLSDVWRKYDS